MTPRQFVALIERHNRAEEWQDYRAGIIASTIVNMLRGKGSKTYEPKDFMPKHEKQEQTPEQQLAIVENYMKMIGGEDKRWQAK
ncbi:MAG: hypothetical protein A2Y91_03515 [Chloroflexi bacterium RBG_13_54_8]|nr:MAG: hypothetical protein A2Y91_03515 [Chloroflexi bacterium RBG_13_54_8]